MQARSSFVTVIRGHRVHRHLGHRSSLLSEVIVCIVIEVIVRHCYRRSSCASSSRSSCSSLLSEVIVFIVIEVIVVTAIGGHRVHSCHRYHRYRGQNLSSLWSWVEVIHRCRYCKNRVQKMIKSDPNFMMRYGAQFGWRFLTPQNDPTKWV